MVNELQELMRRNVASSPPDDFDVREVVRAGRRRVRARRMAVLGATTVTTAAVLALTTVVLPRTAHHDAGLAGLPPAPAAPTLQVGAAERAVEGSDYRVLASYTNQNLDRDNGQYFDGVTQDGLVLFRDGPRSGQLYPRMALMDPATGEKDWLPNLDVGQSQTWPVQLGADRLVLVAAEGAPTGSLVAYVFNRETRHWSAVKWPGLQAADPFHVVMGPDDRLYVGVPARKGQPPKGGWPVGPGGEADDADAQGDTYHLWSASLANPADVRDEQLTVGDVAFTDTSMVWSDSTNGDAGLIHVRSLSTGAEHAFDPQAGERCNLLSFGATDDRVVLGEYCGTYSGGVRDDRVQILTTEGDQVVTLQGSGLEGRLAGPGGGNVVTLTSYDGRTEGTYLYDLGSDRFLRVSDAVDKWEMGGPAPDGQFLWSTPVNGGHGATQWLGKLLPPQR